MVLEFDPLETTVECNPNRSESIPQIIVDNGCVGHVLLRHAGHGNARCKCQRPRIHVGPCGDVPHHKRPNEIHRHHRVVRLGFQWNFQRSSGRQYGCFHHGFRLQQLLVTQRIHQRKATLTVSDATLTCGSCDLDETAQPLPDTYVEWAHSDSEGFTASHEGPCKSWCDDVRVLQDDDCAADYTTAPAQLPYDHDACLSRSVLTLYWLALHSSTWQVYVNCAPLESTTSTGATSKCATSGASTSTSTTTESTVSSAAGSSAASNSSSYDFQTNYATSTSASTSTETSTSTTTDVPAATTAPVVTTATPTATTATTTTATTTTDAPATSADTTKCTVRRRRD